MKVAHSLILFRLLSGRVSPLKLLDFYSAIDG